MEFCGKATGIREKMSSYGKSELQYRIPEKRRHLRELAECVIETSII